MGIRVQQNPGAEGHAFFLQMSIDLYSNAACNLVKVKVAHTRQCNKAFEMTNCNMLRTWNMINELSERIMLRIAILTHLYLTTS